MADCVAAEMPPFPFKPSWQWGNVILFRFGLMYGIDLSMIEKACFSVLYM